MNITGTMDLYSPVTTSTSSRTQEKEELKQLNERFASYVQRVRQLGERNDQLDSTALLRSSKMVNGELHNLRNMYESELDKLRKELEVLQSDKASLEVKASKHSKYIADIQDRLNLETDKNGRLLDDIINYQRRIGNLEAEIQDIRIASARPQTDIEQLQRNIEKLTRESDMWRKRYEHEVILSREYESKIHQLKQKLDFDEKVTEQRVAELQSRLEVSVATIQSLEARLADVSRTDVLAPDVLKQVRAAAEADFQKFHKESEEQYNKNLTVLKAQIDRDAATIERLEAEKIHLHGSMGELQARIRNLEGQLANLQHQNHSLEDALATKGKQAADTIQNLEKKLREVQDLLVTKMREVTTVLEQSIPLKSEIEALKTLLEEEEKRLMVPLAIASNPLTAPPAPVGALAPVSYMSTYNNNTSQTTETASPTITTSTSPYVNFSQKPKADVQIPPISDNCSPEVFRTAPYDRNTYECVFNGYPDDGLLDPYFFGYDTTQPVDNYIYESTPTLCRLEAESSPSTAAQVPDTARAKSAPAAERKSNLNLVSTCLGQGRDYFDQMFNDLQRSTLTNRSRPKTSSATSTYNDYRVTTTSSTGDIKIAEICQDGSYISLFNDGPQELEIGGYLIQQNVGGHPVAVFRFPPRTKLTPYCTTTVYAGGSSTLKQHSPPTQFVWKEQRKWGTGPECTTILCQPNGQAVAWTTAAHRFNVDIFEEPPRDQNKEAVKAVDGDSVVDDGTAILTEISRNGSSLKAEPVSLRREKQQPPSLGATKHPHGVGLSSPIHPHTDQPHPLTSGHDNGSISWQSHCQTIRPDPIPGQPYAGASAHRLGSAALRKYVSGVSHTKNSKRLLSTKSKENFLNYLLTDSSFQ